MGTRRSDGEIQGKGVESVAAALDASAGGLLDQMLPGLIAEFERDSQGSATPLP